MVECEALALATAVEGPGSRYCFIKGGKHGQESVYFEVDLQSVSLDNRAIFQQRYWSLSTCRTGALGAMRCTSFKTQKLRVKSLVYPPLLATLLASERQELEEPDPSTTYVDEKGERRFAGGTQRLACRGGSGRRTKNRQRGQGYCTECYKRERGSKDS